MMGDKDDVNIIRLEDDALSPKRCNETKDNMKIEADDRDWVIRLFFHIIGV